MLMNVGIFHADRRRTSAFLLPAFALFAAVAVVAAVFAADFGLISEGSALLNDSPACDKHNAILRTLRPSQTRLNGRKIEREQLGVFRFGSLLVVEHSLLAAVSLDQRNLFFTASREPQIAQRLFINRKNPARRSILRTTCWRWWRDRPAANRGGQGRSTRQTFRRRRACAASR